MENRHSIYQLARISSVGILTEPEGANPHELIRERREDHALKIHPKWFPTKSTGFAGIFT
jgi:hypothetical protein